MRRELIAYEDPKSHVSELFRTLRTNVQFINSNKKLRTLLVTSTIPNEGKSWISSNLAITFAQANKRVLLIDADMRKCSLYKIFRVEACPGLSNYLAGMNENNDGNNLGKYVRETEVPNLYLLPAGNIPPNPSELLASSRMTALLNELKREFDLIIIDGTPSKLVTDAVVLSRIVDSTIIVTGHNMVKKDDLSKVIRDIQNVGGRIAGIVYNKKPVSGKKINETYYYSFDAMKVDSRKKQEMEFEQRRQAQRNRANDMIKRDRNSNESRNAAQQHQGKQENQRPHNQTPQQNQQQRPQQRTQNSNINTNANSNTNQNMNQNQGQKQPNITQQHTQPQQQAKSPEDRAAEMLKQFNDYLQKEKENRDKRNF